jgi:predicted TIM-barrel fold metal-dependent hydrolase
MIPIVDTHQHLWHVKQFSLPWLAGLDALNKSFSMSDYMAESAESQVVKTVYMEVDVAPEQRVAEAEFVSGLCRSEDNPMAGAVIAGSPGDSGFVHYIDRFKDDEYIKGVRQVLHVPEAERGTCLQPRFVEGVQYLGELGKSFDLCLRPAELGDAVELVEQCPDTLFVLDHCGNADPQIVSGAVKPAEGNGHSREQWLGDIEALCENGNVICKLSGIVAQAPEHWTAETLAPTINHCIESFGVDGVVFGGDWPVCTLAASLGEWIVALRQIIADRPELDQQKILHDNAARLYGLI